MIVKNEAINLAQNLPILSQLADELIIVDTGSLDESAIIANNFGAQVYTYKWQNDFAAAKNFALEKAKGDWIFFPDADEFLQFNETINLRQMLIGCSDKDLLLTKIVNIDKDNNNKVINEFYSARFWKNHKKIRYINKIHETLVSLSHEEISVGVLESVYIYHTGYSANLIKDKALRNIKMLNQVKTDGIVLAELAEAYLAIGDNKKALYYANESIKKGRQKTTNATKPYRILIELLEKAKQPFKIIEGAIQLAIADFPEMPDFYAEYAKVLANEGYFDRAVIYLEKAIEKKYIYSGLEESTLKENILKKSMQYLDKWRQIVFLAQKIRVVACVIVKNEADNIKRWFESVRQCSDEQIVVDTGSTDETLDILSQLPVQVYSYLWQDDFAAAKNFALSKANADWIIFLDADEYFAAECIDKIKLSIGEAIYSGHNAIFSTEINLDKNNIEINRFSKVRIFENSLRYQGAIHETLTLSAGNVSILENDKTIIYHTGYSDEKVMQKKAKLYLQLIKNMSKGKKIKSFHDMAQCYYALGMYEMARKYFELYFSQNIYCVINDEVSIYRDYINCLIKLNISNDILENKIKLIIKKNPHIPDFYAFLGQLYYQGKQYEKARRALQKALIVFEKWGIDSLKGSGFLADLPLIKNTLLELEKNR